MLEDGNRAEHKTAVLWKRKIEKYPVWSVMMVSLITHLFRNSKINVSRIVLKIETLTYPAAAIAPHWTVFIVIADIPQTSLIRFMDWNKATIQY